MSRREEIAKEATAIQSAESLLEEVYHLSTTNENSAVDAVIAGFENWLVDENWVACHHTLANADVCRLTPAVSLAILSMTLAEKERFAVDRQAFYARCRHKLIDDLGVVEAEKDLRGLQ